MSRPLFEKKNCSNFMRGAETEICYVRKNYDHIELKEFSLHPRLILTNISETKVVRHTLQVF